jgi:hypothetical protein
VNEDGLSKSAADSFAKIDGGFGSSHFVSNVFIIPNPTTRLTNPILVALLNEDAEFEGQAWAKFDKISKIKR